MQTKKMICMILMCAFVLGTVWVPVHVEAAEITFRDNEMMTIVDTRASGSFIPGNDSCNCNFKYFDRDYTGIYVIRNTDL